MRGANAMLLRRRKSNFGEPAEPDPFFNEYFTADYFTLDYFVM